MKKFLNIFYFKNIINFIFSLSFYIFSLCLIVKLTFFSTFIYKISLNLFSIPLNSSFSKSQILSDYNEVISYITNINNSFLNLKTFTLSDKASYHFYEVKQVFNSIDFFFIFFSLLILIYILNLYKHKNLSIILNNISNFLLFSTLFLLTFCLFKFDLLFEFMHNIIFNNNYWLFNPEIDHIITIFPKEFFILCFFFCLILLLVIIISLKLLSKYISYQSKLCNKE